MELRRQNHHASGAANLGAEFGFFASIDGDFQTECHERLRKGHGIGIGDGESIKTAALRRVDGGVNGVRIPLDEEGKDAVAIVGKIQSSPLEQAAIGPGA